MINRPASIEPPIQSRHGINYDAVLPHDSASHVGGDSPLGSHIGQQRNAYEEQPFPFKFKAPSGRVHRIQVLASGGLAGITHAIVDKLGAEVDEVGGAPIYDEEGRIEANGFAISYVDDEGDVVSITSDQDLLDSISIARNAGQDKVDLYVHDPTKPAVPVVVEAPTPAPAQKPVRRRTHRSEDEDSEEEADRKHRRKSKVPAPPPAPEQLIQGIPNELILPGAMVTLALTIVIVFTLSRSSR